MQREEKHICRVFSHTNTDVQITHTQKITLRSQQDKPETQRKRSNSQGRKPKGPRNTRQDGIRNLKWKQGTIISHPWTRQGVGSWRWAKRKVLAAREAAKWSLHPEDQRAVFHQQNLRWADPETPHFHGRTRTPASPGGGEGITCLSDTQNSRLIRKMLVKGKSNLQMNLYGPFV